MKVFAVLLRIRARCFPDLGVALKIPVKVSDLKIGIMQPYFLPYIGYFQLIQSVEKFVVYDNIKYTKKGWINRNRMLRGEGDVTFSLSLKKDSDDLDVRDRLISRDFRREKILNQFRETYRKAPMFGSFFPILERIVLYKDDNLFNFILNSIENVCKYIGIDSDIKISSLVNADHSLKGAQRVLAICEAEDAKFYVNPIGGLDLYSKEIFSRHGVNLFFLKSKPLSYRQYGAGFVPWLSIVDVVMFNPQEVVADYICNGYDLI